MGKTKTDLLDAPVTEALAPVEPEAVELDPMIERMAANPAVDVDKFERLIAMRERILAAQAKSEFDAAYAVMAPKIPAIDEKGQIKKRDGTVQSRYARLEDIQAVVKPILAEYGFALRYRTEWPQERDGVIRVVGILTHRNGHSEESVFEAPMDRSDYRTDVQSQGSTISYGRRYTTIDLLNIETRGLDNDGQTAGNKRRDDVNAPEGFSEWLAVIEPIAANGTKELTDAWNKSKPEYRNHLIRTNKPKWDALKETAKAVQR